MGRCSIFLAPSIHNFSAKFCNFWPRLISVLPVMPYTGRYYIKSFRGSNSISFLWVILSNLFSYVFFVSYVYVYVKVPVGAHINVKILDMFSRSNESIVKDESCILGNSCDEWPGPSKETLRYISFEQETVFTEVSPSHFCPHDDVI